MICESDQEGQGFSHSLDDPCALDVGLRPLESWLDACRDLCFAGFGSLHADFCEWVIASESVPRHSRTVE